MKLRTVDGALRTLELLAERGRLGVRDVAAALACSRSSAYRIVRTLQDRGWAREAGVGSYELGPLAHVLGTRALQRLSLRDVALPWMRKLVDATEESVTVSVLVGNERVCVDQLESPRQVRMTVLVGQPYPLYAGASGKAILVAMEPEARERYLAATRLVRLAPNTLLSRERLRASLAEASARGFVVSVAERDPEAFSVAAPLVGRTGVTGALAICGPVSRFVQAEAERYGGLVRDAAERISHALGAESGGGGPGPPKPARRALPRPAGRARGGS